MTISNTESMQLYHTDYHVENILHIQSTYDRLTEYKETMAPVLIYNDHLSRYREIYKDKTVVRQSYLYNGNSCFEKTAYLY